MVERDEMLVSQQTVEAALASLHSGVKGLATEEVAHRLQEFGANKIYEYKRRPLIFKVLGEYANFFSIVLLIAAGLAFLLEQATPNQGMARLGYTITAVIVISGIFSFWQEFRVEKTLTELRRLLPSRASVIRDGQPVEISVDQLVPGDVVILEQGDSIPADCRLIEAYGLRVNNANVTGESSSLVRDTQPCSEGALIYSTNVLLAGTSVVAGRCKGVVFSTGMRTEFGRIAHFSQTGSEELSPLRREINHLSQLIVFLSVGLAILFFMVGWLIGFPLWQNFIFAIGLIVAMVPEGLLPTLTLSLVLATKRMAKRNVLIRHLPAVEALGSTTVICTDKTGTLTENRMSVKSILARVGDNPIAASDAIDLVDRYRPLFLTAGLCHDLTETRQAETKSWRGDPMEIGLVAFAQQAIDGLQNWSRTDEYPFDTDRMRLSVIYENQNDHLLFCKGAPEKILEHCTRTLEPAGEQYFTQEQKAAVLKIQEEMAESGLRVIAAAWKKLPAGVPASESENDLIFAGLIGLEDLYRSEVPEAIATCHKAGIRVIMVTGDHPRTALAVAREIGLVSHLQARVVCGDELRQMSDAQLQLVLDDKDVLFARVGAEQKTRIVEALKAKGHIVAVTGDGVNDAPALKSAHIGVAMGLNGTDVAKEAADLVLLDDNFASIVKGIEEGRAVFDNIRKFLTYILTHNVPELIPYLAFALFRVPLALTPIQMLAVDMGTDSITALGLGVERAEPDVMQRPPRSPKERLLNWRLAVRAYLFLGIISATTAMAVFFIVLMASGWHYGDAIESSHPQYIYATTACLGSIVLLQVVNVFLCRSPTRSLWETGFMGNWLILAGVVFELGALFLITYTTTGNEFFGTAPLSINDWILILPFGVALVVLEEGRKWLVRRFRKV
jgi:calcium-translocating P-type ATPase